MAAWMAVLAMASPAGAVTNYVIEISVDGMGSSYLQNLINAGQTPNFAKLKNEGAYTFNARNDYEITVTLPNHITMVTGRGIYGVNNNGHLWTSNSDPAVGQTIHSNKGSYVASVFDVAHDNGLRTSMYATKTKFSLFQTSYDATNGALDVTGVNNGRNKLDTYYYNSSSSNITSTFVSAMNSNPFHYSFLHFTDPDTAGHSSGWGSTAYNNSLVSVDGYLASIFNLVTNNATLKNKTTIIVTADHGGTGTDHSVASDPLDYTIPFFVWHPGDVPNSELYSLNAGVRLDPGTGRPLYSAAVQPIRNGDGANLSLELLGLGAIPGSTINAQQNLNVTATGVPEPSAMGLLIMLAAVSLRRTRRGSGV